jgi:hypothetical protein
LHLGKVGHVPVDGVGFARMVPRRFLKGAVEAWAMSLRGLGRIAFRQCGSGALGIAVHGMREVIRLQTDHHQSPFTVYSSNDFHESRTETPSSDRQGNGGSLRGFVADGDA